MAFNVNYSFNNGETTGIATSVTQLRTAIKNYSNLTQCTLSGTAEGELAITSGLFEDCRSLTSVDLSNFDTSNVTTMIHMFYDCTALTALDLSNFNTSNVTNMREMFYNCRTLTNLELSNFNTSNVTDMDYMFSRCQNLTTLDLSNFDTSNVLSMYSMFELCESLTSLDPSSWNTNNTTNMNRMFSDCYNLISLDLSNFDTSKVTEMSQMFGYCYNLKHIYIGENWDVTGVTNSNNMFYGCISLPNYNSSYKDKTKAYVGEGGYLELAPTPSTKPSIKLGTLVRSWRAAYTPSTPSYKVGDKLTKTLTGLGDFQFTCVEVNDTDAWFICDVIVSEQKFGNRDYSESSLKTYVDSLGIEGLTIPTQEQLVYWYFEDDARIAQYNGTNTRYWTSSIININFICCVDDSGNFIQSSIVKRYGVRPCFAISK